MNYSMKIEIDTKEDSHEEIRKAIKLLQHIIGDNQEVFTNAPTEVEAGNTTKAFNNIFGDSVSSAEPSTSDATTQETKEEQEASESTESTEDLFAELFSEEELKKMEPVKEEEEVKPKKKYSMEFY